MNLNIYQVDAFHKELFRGNPAAVVPLEEWISDEMMQKIALENNLSETAFFVPEGDGYHLRWFTPVHEVNLCGHATLATSHVLFHHLGVDKDAISFKSRSGELIVSRDGAFYMMDFPTDKLEPVEIPAALSEGLGLMPNEVFRGRDDHLAIFDTQAQVDGLKPDFEKLKELPGRGVIASAPGEEFDFISRGFFPNSGVNEDPVTGSAHTTLTPYWAKTLNKNILTAEQRSTRRGVLQCELAGDRTILRGQAVTYLTGEINVGL